MSATIDKRVVEMQFDNKQFEHNCQQSISTLEKLKMALDFDGAKGLETMAKAADKVDLSNLSKSADAVTVRFNAMNIAGMTAISELTKGIINFGKNVWNASFGQMKSGGMARTLKIEQAMFKMEALANNMESIKGNAAKLNTFLDQMKDSINAAVDGTAYGYDAAASVASQLVASGITNAEKMEEHLRAVAGAAAMTGRSYEDIGNIFTTVASNGKLMTMQLRQFSFAGLNLAATLADHLNTTEAAVNEMVTKGQIDFETFSEALSDAFGKAAGKADDTFAGVTSNIKAQLSKVGQLFTDPFVEHMIPLLKVVKQKIKDIRSVLTPVSKTWEKMFKFWTESVRKALEELDLTKIEPIINGVENILATLIMIVGTIRRAFLEVFPKKTLDELHSTALMFEELTASLIPSEETLQGLKEVIMALLVPVRLIFNLLRSLASSVVKPILIALANMLGAILRIGNSLSPLIGSMVKAVTESKIFNNILSIIAATLIVLINAITEIIKAFDYLVDKVANSASGKAILSMLKAISTLISQVLVGALTILFTIIQKIFSYVKAENIIKIFKAIGAGIAILITFIDQVIATTAKFIESLANSGNIIGEIINIVKDIFGKVTDFFSGKPSKEIDGIGKSTEKLGDRLKNLFNMLSEEFKKLDVGKVMLLAFGIAIIFLIKSVSDFVTASTGLVKKITSFFGIFDSLKKALKNIGRFTPVFQMFLGMIFLISAITTALITLSNNTEPEKLKQTAIILGLFVGVLAGLAITIGLLESKLPQTKAISNTFIGIAALAGAMLLLTLALKQVVEMEIVFDKAMDVLKLMGAMLAGLTVAAILMSKFGENGGIAGALGIIAFVMSLRTLFKLFNEVYALGLDNAQKWEAAWKSVALIIGIIGGIALSMTMMGAVGVTAGVGSAFIGFTLSLLALVVVMKQLASFNYEQMESAFLRLCMILVPILSFIAGATLAVRLSKQGDILKDLAKMLTALNFAMLGIVAAVALFGKFQGQTLIKGFTAVSLIYYMIGSLVRSLFKSMGSNLKGMDFKVAVGALKQMSKLLLAISAATILVAMGAKMIASIDEDRVTGSLIAVAAIFVVVTRCMGYIIKCTKQAKDLKVGSVLAIIFGISALMGALAILSFHDPANILAAGFAMSIVMVALGIMVKLSEKSLEVQRKTGKKLNYKTIIGTVVAISAIMLSVAMLLDATQGVTENQVDIFNISIMAVIGIFSLIVLLLVALNTIKNKNFSNNANALGQLIVSFAETMFIISGSVALLVSLTKLFDDLDSAMIVYASVFGILSMSLVVIFGLMTELIKNSEKMTINKINTLTNMVKGVALSMAIIAGSLAGLTAVLSLTGNHWGTMILSGLAMAGLLEMIFLLYDQMIVATAKTNESKLKTITKMILLASASLAIIAASVSVLTGVMGGLELGVPAGIASMITMGVLVADLFFFLTIVIAVAQDIDDSKLEMVGKTMLLAGATMAIIAASLAGLAVAIHNFSSFGSLMSAFLAIFLTFSVMVGAIVGIMILSKKFNDNNLKAFKSAKDMVLTLTTMLMVIAGIMTILAYLDIGNTDQFNTKVKALQGFASSITNFIMIMMVIISAFELGSQVVGKQMNWSSISSMLTSVSVAFMSIAASMFLISGAIAILISAISKTSPENLTKAIKTLETFFTLISVFIGISAIVGGLTGGAGKAISTFVLAISGAVLILSVSGLALAKAVDILVGAVERLNSIDVDSEGIKRKFTDSIKAIAEMLTTFMDEMVPVITRFLLGLAAVFGVVALVVANHAALGVIAFVLAVIFGLGEVLPTILDAIKKILVAIIDFLGNEDNMNIIEQFATVVGNFIADIIIGIVKGLFKDLSKAINEYTDKLEAKRRARNEDNLQYALQQEAKLRTAEYKVEQLQNLGYSRAGLSASEKDIENYKKFLEKVKSGKIILKEGNDSSKILKRMEDKIFGADGNPIITGYLDATEDELQEVERVINNRLHGDMTTYSRTQWLKELNKLNALMKQQQDAGLDVDIEYFRNLAEAIGMPLEFMDRLGPEYYDTMAAIIAKDDELLAKGQEVQENTEKVIEESKKAEEAATEAAKETEEKTAKTTSDAMKAAMEGFSQLKSGIEDIDVDIPGVLSSVGSELAGALGDSLNGVTIGDFNLGELASGLINFGGETGTKMGEELGENFVNTVEWWIDYGNELVETDNGMMERWKLDPKAYESVKKYAEAQVEVHKQVKKTTEETTLANKALSAFYGITGLDETVKSATSGLNDIANSFTDVGDSAEKATEKVEKSKTKLQEFKEGLTESIQSSIGKIFDKVSEEELISPKEMLYRLTKNSMAISEWARNISTLAARGMSEGLLNELKDMGPEGADKVKAFVNMTDEQLQEANRRWSAASAMPNVLTKEITNSYKEAGFNASLGFKQGIDKKAANEAMRELAKNSLTSLEDELEIHSPSRKTMKDGEFATQGFAKGVTSEKSVNFVKQAATAITNIFMNSMRNNLSSTKMIQFGQFSIQGLAQGFQKAFPTASSSISDIAQKIANIFTSKWEMHSPSKLFEDFGLFAMQGLGKGFKVGTDETSDELTKDSDYILNSMRNSLKNTLESAGEESIYRPTIQPVFDLSALDQGFNDIQSWFNNNPGLSLDGNIRNVTTTKNVAGKETSFAEAMKMLESEYDRKEQEKIQEIRSLRDDISNLQTAMSSMKVMMNSKALVGQIVTDMDVALGNRVVKNQRGRY